MTVRTPLRFTGYALVFGLSGALAGYIGFSESMKVMTAPAPARVVATAVPAAPPVHDRNKPTVAVLLGNTLSEPTDVLGPYAMFAESGAYNVYTVAASRTVLTLTGGLDLVPHLSFAELADRLHGDPEIVVVPQIVDIRAKQNAPVVDWVRRQSRGQALLFSWCTGAEVLAESGALDGKAATAHWGDIDWLKRRYPKVRWQRGVRYVEGGAILSTAGLTAGVDATLHLLARRHGTEMATRVADALHLPASPFVENPKCPQFKIGPADSIFLLNAAYRWPKPTLRVQLYDGVGELELGAAADVYGVSAGYRVLTLSTAPSVVSKHGIQFVSRESQAGVPSDAIRTEPSAQFAYIAAIEDLARRQNSWTARFAAKRLEIRAPLSFGSNPWPIRVLLTPILIGCVTLPLVLWLKGTARSLELKIPPLALAGITAALMWCAASAVPDCDFQVPSNLIVSAALALLGGLTCLAGVAAFRRAKTTVNPMKPDSTSSLVISGIYGYTRNPMYLGFLLLLLAWAAALCNVLALVSLIAFIPYMNRFQILPEERILSSRFAQDYSEYRDRVRRWL
jgi:protein-S-isoprenylcysteine O-methyltransferase Ste14/putative intracellular protease/amidase